MVAAPLRSIHVADGNGLDPISVLSGLGLAPDGVRLTLPDEGMSIGRVGDGVGGMRREWNRLPRLEANEHRRNLVSCSGSRWEWCFLARDPPRRGKDSCGTHVDGNELAQFAYPFSLIHFHCYLPAKFIIVCRCSRAHFM